MTTTPARKDLLTVLISRLHVLKEIDEFIQLIVFLQGLQDFMLGVEGERGNPHPLLSKHLSRI